MKKDAGESLSPGAVRAPDVAAGLGRAGTRIALLTPYTGNNFGDAAIQDSMIANLRARIPGARFSGISLNCQNFVARHGERAFPLCATDLPFYGMAGRTEANSYVAAAPAAANHKSAYLTGGKEILKKIPLVRKFLNACKSIARAASKELRHSAGAYRFLQTQELLIVSGGGQLDEEWGGPWGLPYTLFKWTLLAKIAGVRCAVTSVGAGNVTSSSSRFFLSLALRGARYRSYRDKNSRQIAASFFRKAQRDPVVPDLAFSVPKSEMPGPAGLRSLAGGRTTVAISPISFAKPGSWPSEDSALYERYLSQMARVIADLIKQDRFVVMVWSAVSDRKVIAEILERLDAESKRKSLRQIHTPEITTWRNLIAVLLDADFFVASRLHSVILGALARRPIVAVSFDPKVDWVMEDLGQTDCVLQIRDFTADDVIRTLDGIERRKQIITDQIDEYLRRVLPESGAQYDIVAGLAQPNDRDRN